MRFNEWYLDVLSMFDVTCFAQERADKLSLTQMLYETDLLNEGLPLLHRHRRGFTVQSAGVREAFDVEA